MTGTRTLYHLAISHYSEKARWALDFKELQYEGKVLVPGFHRISLKRRTGTTTVPVLVDESAEAPLTDSTEIIAHLEAEHPNPPLYPVAPDERRKALEIEEFFDERCGTNVSRFAYHVLLDHPAILRRRWEAGLNGRSRVLLRLGMPLIRFVMRRSMEVSADDAVRHRAAIDTAYDRLESWLDESGSDYLVGNRFSVADLTAACMLGPVAMPAGSPWAPRTGGDEVPAKLRDFRAEFQRRDATLWVRDMWRRHRFRDQRGPC